MGPSSLRVPQSKRPTMAIFDEKTGARLDVEHENQVPGALKNESKPAELAEPKADEKPAKSKKES
jgi:hypothetical protein